jgi:hypothetical protein
MWKQHSNTSLSCRDMLLRNMDEYQGPSYYFYPNHSYDYNKLINAKLQLMLNKPCSILLSSSEMKNKPIIPTLSTFHSAVLNMKDDSYYHINESTHTFLPRNVYLTPFLTYYVCLVICILLTIWYGYRTQATAIEYVIMFMFVFLFF